MRYRSTSENITPILVIVAINLLVLVATFFSGNLISLLGLSGATFFAQPWTIITSMFTHAGIMHLLFNMISLYFLGRFLLGLLGNRGFLITYIGGGIFGGIMFLLLASPFNIGIGASGAVYALGGALVVLAPKMRVFIFPIPAPIPLWVAILIFLALSFLPQIAWQAHIGGLIFGLIVGFYYRKRIPAVFY
jgi:membrane associated rhomboid family serine protease